MCFSAVFALFLLVLSLRKIKNQEWAASNKGYIIPLFIFMILASFSVLLYQKLVSNQIYYFNQLVESESNKIELLFALQIEDKLTALKRMAQRWIVAGGTPYKVWQSDAQNYIKQMSGLKAIEWVDAGYRIRWVEPMPEYGKYIDLSILDGKNDALLKAAAVKNELFATQSIHLDQGYDAFVNYFPLHIGNKFDGFMVSIFS